MHLIIAEKNLAGQRIAEILGGKTTRSQARGFAKYYTFSRGADESIVIPLRGHIVEVDFPKQYSYWKGTDLKELAKAPILYSPNDASIAALMKDLGKSATKVIIATDADREGESIGVEALRIVQEVNPSVNVERAYFSAMTPKELVKSFDELVHVDYNLSDSADARREIDLIWGAALTRFVSIMGNRMGKDFISVGRVQTPVLALIVNREKERLAFVVQPYWEIIAHAEKDSTTFDAFHKNGKMFDEHVARQIFEKIKDEKKALVKKVSKKKRMVARPIPFDTTTMLRAASALGFTAGQAMNTAESLYMAGYISYPRTDNQTYPSTMNLREHLEELKNDKTYAPFVDGILAAPLNPSKGPKNTTDHPPVHPTKVPERGKIGDKEWKFFDLVARRFLATFMPDAETENTSVELDIKSEPFAATGQTILFAGWKAVYPFSELKETILPTLHEGEFVPVNAIEMPRKETQPPARYSQSALLKLMEENNLGTKATRADIIQKLYARQYISGIKSIEPNQIAFAVIDSLEKHSRIVTEPKMTAELELEMDNVAVGKTKKTKVVDDSRVMLLQVLDQLLLNKNAISLDLKKALFAQDSMGKCPNCAQGKLVMRKAAATQKRFLGCDQFPNCRTTFPLPQKGTLFPTNKVCPTCNKAPLIKLSGKKFKMEICVNYDCPSKDAWKKSLAEKENAPPSTVTTATTSSPAKSLANSPTPSSAAPLPSPNRPRVFGPSFIPPKSPPSSPSSPDAKKPRVTRSSKKPRVPSS